MRHESEKDQNSVSSIQVSFLLHNLAGEFSGVQDALPLQSRWWAHEGSFRQGLHIAGVLLTFAC